MLVSTISDSEEGRIALDVGGERVTSLYVFWMERDVGDEMIAVQKETQSRKGRKEEGKQAKRESGNERKTRS
jgi:hypothetical protein